MSSVLYLQLLLADKCGQLMIPHELTDKQFQGLQRVAKENSLPDADVLLVYSKDSESPSARYQLQVYRTCQIAKFFLG